MRLDHVGGEAESLVQWSARVAKAASGRFVRRMLRGSERRINGEVVGPAAAVRLRVKTQADSVVGHPCARAVRSATMGIVSDARRPFDSHMCRAA